MILLLKDEGPKPHSKESEKWWKFLNNKLNMKRISCTMGHVILPCFHNCDLIMDASVVNIEQLDQKEYWMERMVDNVSQTGLRVGSLNQCWMVLRNRNRPLAVIRVALRVHDLGSKETKKNKKNQRNDSDLLTVVLWSVHLRVHSWLSLVLDSIPCWMHCVGWSHKCGIFVVCDGSVLWYSCTPCWE